MLTKSFSILQIFARQREEKKQRALTKREWVNVDRIVMIVLFLSVIIGAIVFSL